MGGRGERRKGDGRVMGGERGGRVMGGRGERRKGDGREGREEEG